ncbi:MAG: flagellar basal body rod protein FlgF [Pseudomonadales bacterium]|nr:flagellar basal body rod protein FlgF [Pseudomonadales bacterium]
MDKSLYLAMSGAKQTMLAQSVHANNLANATTTGFKADLAQARSMQVFGGHHPSRVFALSENPATQLAAGPMQSTGGELDIAVKGDGWIAVQRADGSEAYSRDGALSITADGALVNGTGLVVLGNGGPINIPPAQKLEIGIDGTISIVGLGEGPETMAEVDRIKLVNPDAGNMEKGRDGLMQTRDGTNPPPDALVRIESGFLEGSNVNPVESMTEILSLARKFELQLKVMQAAESADRSSAQLLRIS